jgi:hypothetical protein
MANRNITNPAQLAAMARSAQRCADLVELTLGTTTFYFTNAAFTVLVGAKSYLPLGDFMGFTDVEETSDLAIATVTITLSGIDPLTVGQWLADDYIDKPVKIYRVYFDENWAVIGDPLMLFDGRIDSPMVQDTGTSVTVGCKAASQWTDFNRRNGRFTSIDLQQSYFPTDLGFQYAAVDTPNLKWGG